MPEDHDANGPPSARSVDRQSDGSTTRLQGVGQAGTWELDQTSSVDTSGRLYVYFNNAPGSSLWASVSFMVSPRVMQFDPALYAPLQ